MQTPHLTERMLTLCALIVEEKDPGKFLLLVRELNDAFENGERKVKHARLTTTRHTAKVLNISSQAFAHSKTVLR